MTRKNYVCRIAITVAVIGLTACSGSDSSSNRQKNSAIATNVSHMEGSMAVTLPPTSPEPMLPTTNTFKMSVDLNLDTKGSGDNTNYNLRSAFSNFKLEKTLVAESTRDFSEIMWATCPVDAHLGTNPGSNSTAVDFLELRFQETTTELGCTVPVSNKKSSLTITLMHADGSSLANVADNATVSLKELGLDDLTNATKYSVSALIKVPNDTVSPYTAAVVLSAEKINDYQPFDLSATSNDAGVAVKWSRSADLTASDQVGYNLEWSVDSFNTVSGNLAITENVETANIQSCLITRSFPDFLEKEFSVRLTPRIGNNDKSGPITTTVIRSDGEFQCPTDKPAAPTNVGAKIAADGNSIEVSWDAVSIPDTSIEYCVFQVIPISSGASKAINVGCSESSPLIVDFTRNFEFNSGTATYFVRTTNKTLHSISDDSTNVTTNVPTTPSITDISSSLTDDGSLLFRWKPLSKNFSDKMGLHDIFETILFFSVNQAIPCDADMSPMEFIGGMGQFMKANAVDENWIIDHIRFIRAIDGGQIFSPQSLGNEFLPGSTTYVCILRLGPWGLSKLAAGSFSYPDAIGTTVPASQEITTTIVPIADETARAAIIAPTATEVQLPASDVVVAVNLNEFYSGFGVSASDVKLVEYQVADGSWVALTEGKSMKIPKTASKLSVRVTKTNGEKVVSEKVIVHTEAATETTVAAVDTTAAPISTTADSTAPVTTEAPTSSDSSSSNNTVLYILGFAIVAGAVAMLIKKKAPSTK